MTRTAHPPTVGAGAWRELLGAPGVGAMVVAGLVARLPVGMNALAVVLLVRDSGQSYAGAGLVAAATALSTAVGTPVLARLIDRIGQPRVLVPAGLGFAASIALLIVLAQGGASLGLLCASAALAGALVPPISASVRALWPGLVPRAELRGTAFALEASLQELFFLVGPLLVALCVVVASPAVAVGVAGAAGGLGTLAFAATAASRTWRPEAHDPASSWRRAGPLAHGGVRILALVSVGMGIAFGSFEIGMPAFGEAHGSRAAGGLALAGISLGSLLGGLWMGTRPPTGRPVLRMLVALGAFAAALAGPLLAWSIPAMAAFGFLLGLPIAPAFSLLYGLMDDVAPRGTATEAFAWISTAVILGVAVGTSAAGGLIESAGVDAGFALGWAAAGAALLVAGLGRGSLRPGAAPG